MMASHFMEAAGGNAPAFADAPAPDSAGEYADQPATGVPDFQEAPPLLEMG